MLPVTGTFYAPVLLIIVSHSRTWYKLLLHCISNRYVMVYINATNVVTKSFVNLYVCAVGVRQSDREGMTAVRKRTGDPEDLLMTN